MKSNQYKHWVAILDLKTCPTCRSSHGKIYLVSEIIFPAPPIHPRCRCIIDWMIALLAGTATKNGYAGADWYLKVLGKLPDYYISYFDALNSGWNPKAGDLAVHCPNKMICSGIYHNKNGHLPSAPGRVWYEADINYTFGFRGSDRILFSNDGLIFVTYDHYKSFQVIV